MDNNVSLRLRQISDSVDQNMFDTEDRFTEINEIIKKINSRLYKLELELNKNKKDESNSYNIFKEVSK